MKTTSKCFAALILAVLSVSFASTALAKDKKEKERKEPFAKQGLFLELAVGSVEGGKDFDGERFVTGGGSSEVMPDFDGTGYRVSFGRQYRNLDWEGNVEIAEMDGPWMGFPMEGRRTALNFDFRKYWLNRVRPFVLFGLGLQHMKVDDGSTDLVIVEDATFKGGGFRFGGGVQVPLRPRWSLMFQTVYRWEGYGDVSGVVSGEIESRVSGRGLSSTAGMRFVFGK